MQKDVAKYVATIREVNAVLGPENGRTTNRRRRFETLAGQLIADANPIHHQMGRVMASFQPGLFVGGSRGHWPSDNLDLERWFRLPKGHERRIHGRCHAGMRIVQEGATLMLALDAHRQHPQPFTEQELRAYRDAEMPSGQKEALHRRKVMHAARSTKKRTVLLRNLEERYAASPPQTSG